MKYRKKPVVIEAKQLTQSSMFEIIKWVRTNGGEAEPFPEDIALYIDTLEGVMRANEGDWIICGVHGEFYPCKPDIFEATYERVDE